MAKINLQAIKKICAGRATAINLCLLFILVSLFIIKFEFAFGSKYPCLPAELFLLDKKNKDFSSGDLIAFTMPINTRFLVAGDPVIKIVAGTEGETLTITSDYVYNQNRHRHYTVSAKYIARKYDIPVESIEKTITIPKGQMFMLGTTKNSWDSRFWGTINVQSAIGKAYVIF